MNSVPEIKMFGNSGCIGGIMIHVVAVAHLLRTSVTATIMRHDAVAVLNEEQHLRIPVVGG